MQEEHIPAVLQTGLFSECKFSRLLEQDEADGITYTAQYHCADLAQYHEYIEKYAAGLRDQTNLLYGGRFVAFRTLMEVISEYPGSQAGAMGALTPVRG